MSLNGQNKPARTLIVLTLIFLVIEVLDELVDGVQGAAYPLIRNDLHLSYKVSLLIADERRLLPVRHKAVAVIPSAPSTGRGTVAPHGGVRTDSAPGTLGFAPGRSRFAVTTRFAATG